MRRIKEAGILVFSVGTIIALALSSLLSCGGNFFATGEMTLTVNPPSVSVTYNGTNTTSTMEFKTSVQDSEGNAVPGVTVIGRIDSFLLSGGYLTFPDCQGKTSCSCTTNSVGYCLIRVNYKLGTGINYSTDIMFDSGPLVQTVRFEVSDQ